MRRLAQITDTHLFADANKCGYADINPYHQLRKILEHVAAEAPDALLITGDISGDYSAQSYQHLANLLQRHLPRTPYWWIPGNHDNLSHLCEALPEADLCQQGPVEFPGWHMHGLNSQFEGAKGQVDARQLSTLEARVKQAEQCSHLVAVHHHPVPTGGWMDKHLWVNRQNYLAVLQRQSHIRVTLYGHIHMQKHDEHGQCDLLACPATCWQWGNAETFGVSTQASGYRILCLQADGTYSTHVHRLAED